VEASGRIGPIVSDMSETVYKLRPVVSVWSGGVGLVCGMKRGISIATLISSSVSGPSQILVSPSTH